MCRGVPSRAHPPTPHPQTKTPKCMDPTLDTDEVWRLLALGSVRCAHKRPNHAPCARHRQQPPPSKKKVFFPKTERTLYYKILTEIQKILLVFSSSFSTSVAEMARGGTKAETTV